MFLQETFLNLRLSEIISGWFSKQILHKLGESWDMLHHFWAALFFLISHLNFKGSKTYHKNIVTCTELWNVQPYSFCCSGLLLLPNSSYIEMSVTDDVNDNVAGNKKRYSASLNNCCKVLGHSKHHVHFKCSACLMDFICINICFCC